MVVSKAILNINLIRKILHRLHIGLPLINVLDTDNAKNCLMVYVQEPFLQTNVNSIHQLFLQCIEIAKIMNNLGYNVDVINYYSKYVHFNKKYDAVFDICPGKKLVYRKNLKPDAKKVVYFTGSEPGFANRAELERIRNLEKRRGSKIKPRRQSELNFKEVEKFDVAILIGDEYNFSTYGGFNLPKTYLVPNTGYDFGNRFDLSKRKSTSFLYFGSYGCVHKGLDLLLEVFAEKNFPCTLYVCGNFKDEKDFMNEYKRELFYTDNIKAEGFIDIWSEEFIRICSECCYTILPSCSEARAGAIATCMSAQLIPICSKMCGYSEDVETVTLNDCSKECIRDTILNYAKRDMDWIVKRSGKVLELVEKKYSMKEFIKAMDTALSYVLADKSGG